MQQTENQFPIILHLQILQTAVWSSNVLQIIFKNRPPSNTSCMIYAAVLPPPLFDWLPCQNMITGVNISTRTWWRSNKNSSLSGAWKGNYLLISLFSGGGSWRIFLPKNIWNSDELVLISLRPLYIAYSGSPRSTVCCISLAWRDI